MKFLKYCNTFLHWLTTPFLALICMLLRPLKRKFDIGLGPFPMINNVYWARALKKLHYRVETYANQTYYITSEFDVLFNQGWRKIFYYLPALSFLRCILRYQCVYVYFNGGPLYPIPGLRLIEPALFRLAGVKMVVMPYGSDCHVLERCPNKAMVDAICKDYGEYYQNKHGQITRQVEVWSKGANIVVGAMDTIDYLFFWNRTRLCHYAIDTDEIQPCYPIPQRGQTIKILHAPNHKAVKGTPAVMRAIETLQREGYPVELIFKQGVPNHEFMKIIEQADIVIDQLIIGCYAMFAMEAMSYGKPTICYLREDLINAFSIAGCIEKDDIPLINANTMNITEVLRGLLDAPETLEAYGKKSRAYVEKYHSLDAIGGFLDEINRSLGVFPRG